MKTPEVHPKGWGEEQWIANSPLYCGKRFLVMKDKKCSLHYHKLKDETFFLASGKLYMELPDSLPEDVEPGVEKPTASASSVVVMWPGDAVHIPPLMVHRFTGLEDSVVYEFSTQHFEEDSYRLVKGD